MTEQTINEIIKALAYDQTPEQITESEGVLVANVQQVAVERVNEIQAEHEILRKAGYIK